MRVLAAAAVAASATACTSSSSDSARHRSGSVPGEFLHRRHLPSCGSVQFDSSGRIPATAARCMQAARGSAHGAELAVSGATAEGAPIPRWFRYEPGSRTLVFFEDATKDTFGSRSWLLVSCPHARDLDDVGGACDERRIS